MNGTQSFPASTSEKPRDAADYNLWLYTHHGVTITDATRTHYEGAAAKIKQDFGSSPLWQQLIHDLREYHYQYQIEKEYPLLLNPDALPQLEVKPWKSFVDKTYRENVIKNVANWPDAPKDGWILPSNWYTRINDIVRTILVVKYLDGVKFLAEKIKSLCGGKYERCDWEAKEEGYYAAHLYTREEFELPPFGFDTVKASVLIEIQITTQIQEVIRKLLHNYYERKRSNVLTMTELVWQWDYEREEFVVNYLGHILHYIEGMIMEIRDKEKHHGKT